MKERLELVTDFATLRAGMIVVGKPCLLCNGAHRGMLLARQSCPVDGTCFILMPTPPCDTVECHIGPGAVKLETIFRVVDPGLESSHHQTTKRKQPATTEGERR